MNKCKIGLLLIALSVMSLNATANIESNSLKSREIFQQAEHALKKKDLAQFKSLKKQIKDYSITPYLEFDLISRNLKSRSTKEVHAFLKQYKNFPFTYRLRAKWLHRLAKQKNWKQFLADYDGRNDTSLKCLSYQAKIALGKTKGLLSEIETVWLQGYSQPKQCDAPFNYLLTHNKNSTEIIWGRIEKAFKSGKSSLARYLSQKLSKKDQQIVTRWYRAHKNPEGQLKKLQSAKNTEINRKIIVHAVQRLIRHNVQKAQIQWAAIEPKFPFNQQQKDAIQQRIALSSSYQHLPQAKVLLKALPKRLKTDKTDIWLARSNIREQDWRGLIEAINQMPDHLQQKNEWQYWMARSFDSLGFEAKAGSQFKTLAKKGSYYGFLAADKASLPYTIDNKSVATKVNEFQLLSENSHLLRARELFYVNRTLDARREWFRGVKQLKVPQIKEAAKLASKWQWHDSAIKTVAKTPHRKDYDLRFPLPYKSLVFKNAKAKELDPSVIYGVMRRESLFDPKAGSWVGALGLMQLMPKTAQSVAKSMGLKKPSRYDILNVENNIKFGSFYFKKVLSKFDNNTALAAAAYNAGPHRVKNWLPENENMDADLWVETIPFNETRKYVQAVLAYSSIFDKSLGKEIKITSRMKKVKQAY